MLASSTICYSLGKQCRGKVGSLTSGQDKMCAVHAASLTTLRYHNQEGHCSAIEVVYWLA